MTIKQHGGIFGRNPKFNEIGGTLTTAAQPNITSLGAQTSNLAFTDGNGIDFSATSGTGTSELFDESEEGEWTVVVSDNSGNDSPTTVTGYYTKIGDIVSVFFAELNSIDTTGLTSGDLFIISLPFTAAQGSCGSVVTDTINLSRPNPFSFVSSGFSTSIIRVCSSAVADSAVLVSNISSGVSDIVRFQLTYKV